MIKEFENNIYIYWEGDNFQVLIPEVVGNENFICIPDSPGKISLEDFANRIKVFGIEKTIWLKRNIFGKDQEILESSSLQDVYKVKLTKKQGI